LKITMWMSQGTWRAETSINGDQGHWPPLREYQWSAMVSWHSTPPGRAIPITYLVVSFCRPKGARWP
jgi:hypothetical protein